MKIILDLDHSFNNYHWEDKEELEEYIKIMKEQLWKYYDMYFTMESENMIEEFDDDFINRFYDILDMFESFEVEKRESGIYYEIKS